MLHTLGASRSGEASDAIDQLLACHARIRAFLATAGRLASTTPASESQTRDAAASLVRYFALAAPLHATDEEQSLEPRLVAAGAGDSVLQALANMRDEHRSLEQDTAAALARWRAIETDPSVRAATCEVLATVTQRLDQRWAAHLEAEERVVFPAARRLLDANALGGVLIEMRSRRESAATR